MLYKNKENKMLKTLKTAIESRTPVKFHYIKPGKDPGERIGNPHAIYIGETPEGEKSTKVDMVQTGGVSDSQKPFPSWRTFDINELTNIVLSESSTPFEIHHFYNPTSERYDSVVKKV